MGPQKLTRIALAFEETGTERTQEFVLQWSSPDGGRSYREIVRQQFNFSLPNATRQVEEYRVELSDVTVLELVILSDSSRGSARASLKSLRLCLLWKPRVKSSLRRADRSFGPPSLTLLSPSLRIYSFFII
jgi:hypothetical protein